MSHSRCARVYLEYCCHHKELGGIGVTFFYEDKLLGAFASFRGWVLFIGGILVSRLLVYDILLLFGVLSAMQSSLSSRFCFRVLMDLCVGA